MPANRPYTATEAMRITNWTDAEIVEHNTILRGVVGSTVHGTSLSGVSDRDEMAICIEPPERVAGLREFEQVIQRDRPQGVRSQAGDLDLVTYGLRKWIRLALKGNPSVLLLLFVPPDQLRCAVGSTWEMVRAARYGQELRDLAWAFASKRAAAPFMGYMQQQRERLVGERGQKRVTRAELVEAYGFDVKYASHIIRLGYQGIEYLTTGRMTLPMPTAQRDDVLAVRRGEWSLDKVLTRSGELEREIKDLAVSSPLPDEPDTEVIETWLLSVYERAWADL